MSDNFEPQLVEDFSGFIKLYSDGSVVRVGEPSFPSLISEEDDDKLGSYKDVVFDEELGLWARLYLPAQTKGKVPLILYFHGGGFCFFTAANPIINRVAQMWAAKLGVIIVSVDYRLAPENRLPAAYNDSIAALRWLRAMKRDGAVADPWLHSNADFSKIFVMGQSAGGNIAHHVGMWAAAQGGEIQVNGMILVYPYFGTADRMPSEEQGALSALFTVEQSDSLWRLALPVGSNRDHEFSNPVAEGAEVALAASTLVLPPMLFVIGGRDILRDKQLQYFEILKKCGKEVEVVMFAEEDHGFSLLGLDEQSSLKLLSCISEFIK